jgi:hypothetical protein
MNDIGATAIAAALILSAGAHLLSERRQTIRTYYSPDSVGR